MSLIFAPYSGQKNNQLQLLVIQTNTVKQFLCESVFTSGVSIRDIIHLIILIACTTICTLNVYVTEKQQFIL